MKIKCKSRENVAGLVVDIEVEVAGGVLTVRDKLARIVAQYGLTYVNNAFAYELAPNACFVTVMIETEGLYALSGSLTYEFHDKDTADRLASEIQQQKDQL